MSDQTAPTASADDPTLEELLARRLWTAAGGQASATRWGLLDPGSWRVERARALSTTGGVRTGLPGAVNGLVRRLATGAAPTGLLFPMPTPEGEFLAFFSPSMQVSDCGRYLEADVRDVGVHVHSQALPSSLVDETVCAERRATGYLAYTLASTYLSSVLDWLGIRTSGGTAVLARPVVRHRLAESAVALLGAKAALESLATVTDPALACATFDAVLHSALACSALVEETHAGRGMLAAEPGLLAALAAIEPMVATPTPPPPFCAARTELTERLTASLTSAVASTAPGGRARQLAHTVAGIMRGARDLQDELAVVEALAGALPAGLCARVVTHHQVSRGYLQRGGPGAASQDAVQMAAIAVTEPSGGSDIAAFDTVLRLEGNGATISGTKTFVAGAADCDVLVVAAAVAVGGTSRPHDVALVVVRADRPEVTVTPLDTAAWRGVGFATVRLDAYPLEPRDLIAGPGSGAAALSRGLARERVVLAAQQIGFARRWLSEVAADQLPRLRAQLVAAGSMLAGVVYLDDPASASAAKLACCAVAADIAESRIGTWRPGAPDLAEALDDLAGARAALAAAGTEDMNRDVVAAGLIDRHLPVPTVDPHDRSGTTTTPGAST